LRQYTMTSAILTDEQRAEWEKNGFIIWRKLFSDEEIAKIAVESKNDTVSKHTYTRDDGQGGKAFLALWNHADDSILGRVARSSRIVDVIEEVLGDEAYHYHSKVSAKKAKQGGAWDWHQDYGYWYNNGCLFPNMASCFIAVDPNTKENGCLQVLSGSHKMGRISHGKTGEQAGADMERVEQALKVLDHVYVVLEPGDALFFHCNVLHTSDANMSDKDRTSLICCYNTKSNNPYKKAHHPLYNKLHKVGKDAILSYNKKGMVEDECTFLDPKTDKSVEEQQ